MQPDTLTVALVTAVFHDQTQEERLLETLDRARTLGAELAVLPELPFNPWSPAGRTPRDEDAEEVDGPRQRLLSAAAAKVGIAVLGGAIIRDPDTGARHNTALLYDRTGSCLTRYRKVHLPQEEGFWEASHYEPGEEPPTVVRGLPMAVGLQICSDVNRPTGFQLLGAMGAELVLAPRCTPAASYERWKLVLRANAVTSGTYVVSVNRPRPEEGVPIGGPSLVIAPDGNVALETVEGEMMAVVVLEREAVRAARADYPGYLKTFPGLYATGWRKVEEGA